MKTFWKKIRNFFFCRKPVSGFFVGRYKTRDDTALKYRMGAGFVGDVNRMHPASIEPCLIDATNPPTAYGQPVVINPTTQAVRRLLVGDTALTDIYGITVRPFPQQQAQSAVDYGAIGFTSPAPPVSGVIDVLRSGYIMVQVVGAAVKGGAVWAWIAADSGSHKQGKTFEIVAATTSTIPLPTKSTFNGSPDANGIAELILNA